MTIIRADEVRTGDIHPIWGKITFAGGPNIDGKFNIASGPLHAALFEPSDPVDIVRRTWRWRKRRAQEEWDRRLAGVQPVWRDDAPLASTLSKLQFDREYPSESAPPPIEG